MRKKLIIILSIVIPIFIGSVVGFTFLGISIHEGNQLKEISISILPHKTTYYVGEEPDYTGIKVQVTKYNHDFYFVDDKDLTFEGFDSTVTAEKVKVTVIYQDLTTSYDVRIVERPQVVSLLESIYLVTLPKTEYKLNEPLDTTGGILSRVYNDGSELRLDLMNKYVYDFDSSTVGTKTLTIKYVEKGILVTTTYDITVSE